MYYNRQILNVCFLLTLLIASCSTEKKEEDLPAPTTIISTDMLPTLTLEESDFLRGTTSFEVEVTNENIDLVSVEEIQLLLEGKDLDFDVSNENNKWLFTFNSLQLEDGMHELTFSASLSSEFELPENEVLIQHTVEVDNYLPTITVQQGYIGGYFYEDIQDNQYYSSVNRRNNHEKSIFIIDKEGTKISEVYDLNFSEGNIDIAIPETTRDRDFFLVDFFTYDHYFKTDHHAFDDLDQESMITYGELTYTAINSISETSPKYEHIENEIVENETKEVTIAYPTDDNISITLKLINENEENITETIENGMRYVTIKTEYSSLGDNYRETNCLMVSEDETNNHAIVILNLLNDGDTLTVSKNDLKDDVETFNVSNEENFRQVVLSDDLNFIGNGFYSFDILEDNIMERTYFRNVINRNVEVKYFSLKRKIENRFLYAFTNHVSSASEFNSIQEFTENDIQVTLENDLLTIKTDLQIASDVEVNGLIYYDEIFVGEHEFRFKQKFVSPFNTSIAFDIKTLNSIDHIKTLHNSNYANVDDFTQSAVGGQISNDLLYYDDGRILISKSIEL
ncbi:hypothetical protein HGP29_11685 [Flammeovirga sp. SR4]|uniref:Uncharacterized protein n=1 Tax=Flammeovirga agarivorans TaxID=2726742 RepID=A0A7X8SKE6_9BACT|nr:hypothetical protein [Flammeovirga agarivorans]